MDLWCIFVLAQVRLCLNIDYGGCTTWPTTIFNKVVDGH